MTCSAKEKRFIELGWELLEHKCRYYECVGGKPIPDGQYDRLEAEYISLANELGQPPTASSMVGFDRYRASCRMVYERLLRTTSKKKSRGK